MMHTEWDHWPVLLFTFQGVAGKDEADGALSAIQAGLDRATLEQRRFVLLVDARTLEQATPVFRSIVGGFARDLADEDARRLAAHVLVTQSRIVRGTVTALSWVSRRFASMRAVDTVQEAVDHLRADPAVDTLGIDPDQWALVVRRFDAAPRA